MRFLRFVVVATCFVSVCGVAHGQGQNKADVETIKQIIKENAEAWKKGDVKTILKYDHPDYSGFFSGGGLLEEGKTDSASLQAKFDAGMKWEPNDRHLKVAVYGNTAVVTGYRVGKSTSPDSDGKTVTVTAHITSVLVKIDGKWSWVHDHLSNLTVPSP